MSETKQFLKSLDGCLLALCIVTALVGSVLIANSSFLLHWLHGFLETKVFHRSFDIGEWAETIIALIAVPAFVSVFFSVCFFKKFSFKSKTILLVFYFALSLSFIAISAALKVDDFAGSDLASDILLAKEAWLSKALCPTNWCYSTEIRILFTHIFAAPVFAFTSNMHIAKTVSSVLGSVFPPLALLFLLKVLKCKSVWTIAFACLLSLCPWSLREWIEVQIGGYYPMLLAMGYCYAGLCFSLVCNSHSQKTRRIFTVLYLSLAFVSGLTSIRYILQFTFPLAAVFVAVGLNRIFAEGGKFNLKEFFLVDKVFYPALGLLASGFGYVCNSLVLSRFYEFANYNTKEFNSFGEIPIMTLLHDFFLSIGYRDRVGVFTPSGIINVLAYVFFVFFFLCLVLFLRKKQSEEKTKLFVLYIIVTTVFNCFVSMNTEYAGRYVLIFVLTALPIVPVLVEADFLPVIRRNILAFVSCVMLLSSSFVTYASVFSISDENDKKVAAKFQLDKGYSSLNKKRKIVSQFLLDNGYSFGYSTFRNANITTFLMDGKLELADVSYLKSGWLTNKRYYEPDYKTGEKVFLLLSDEEAKRYTEIFQIERAAEIYRDNSFVVLHFDTNEIFREEWNSENMKRISMEN